jgi:hypothetical protein
MKLKFSDGPVAIEMDDTLERLVRRALDKAAPGVVDRITIETAEVYRVAKGLWPEKTGRSRAGLRQEVLVGIDNVRGRIMNDVDYAYYVRPKVFYGSTTAWSEYVQRPMREAADKLAIDLPKLVRSSLEP